MLHTSRIVPLVIKLPAIVHQHLRKIYDSLDPIKLEIWKNISVYVAASKNICDHDGVLPVRALSPQFMASPFINISSQQSKKKTSRLRYLQTWNLQAIHMSVVIHTADPQQYLK